MFWLYTALQYLNSMLSKFLVSHTSWNISLTLAAFLLIFVRTTSSSCVNCSSLISSWLSIIFLIGSSVTLGDFLNKFLKCSFHKCICSWLVAFSFALWVLFLLLTSFMVCHTIRDCLISTKWWILLIWSWVYCFFKLVLVNSLFAFLSFILTKVTWKYLEIRWTKFLQRIHH